MAKKRPSAEKKMCVLREYLIDGQPLRTVAKTYDIHPNTVLLWRNRLFEDGATVFAAEPNMGSEDLETAQTRIKDLEKELSHRQKIIDDLTELIQTKKKEI